MASLTIKESLFYVILLKNGKLVSCSLRYNALVCWHVARQGIKQVFARLIFDHKCGPETFLRNIRSYTDCAVYIQQDETYISTDRNTSNTEILS